MASTPKQSKLTKSKQFLTAGEVRELCSENFECNSLSSRSDEADDNMLYISSSSKGELQQPNRSAKHQKTLPPGASSATVVACGSHLGISEKLGLNKQSAPFDCYNALFNDSVAYVIVK